MDNQKSYCLVLSGGGAKGIYHIGVWKALKELDIRINAFVGNSIGAIIAAFIAQGDESTLKRIGDEIGLNYIVDVPDDLIENGEFKLSLKKLKSFRKFYRKTFSKMALDTSPLRKLLQEHIDEDKIRRSGNDLGLVSFNLTDFRPAEVYMEDMEEGELVDYILASSAFPGFEQPKIRGKKYIDGGVFDNIPYAMARQRGYKNIIVVDISGIGRKRRLEIEGAETIYIKNSIKMGGVFDFNRSFLDSYRDLGYLDTLRTFGKLKGYNHFIEPDSSIEKDFGSFIEDENLKKALADFVCKTNSCGEISFSSAVKMIFPKYSKYDTDLLYVFADCAAAVLALERIRSWKFSELFSEIRKKLSVLEKTADELSDLKPRKIKAIIKREHAEVDAIKTPYYYYILVDKYISGKAADLLSKMLFEIFHELAAGAAFIKIFRDFWM